MTNKRNASMVLALSTLLSAGVAKGNDVDLRNFYENVAKVAQDSLNGSPDSTPASLCGILSSYKTDDGKTVSFYVPAERFDFQGALLGEANSERAALPDMRNVMALTGGCPDVGGIGLTVDGKSYMIDQYSLAEGTLRRVMRINDFSYSEKSNPDDSPFTPADLRIGVSSNVAEAVSQVVGKKPSSYKRIVPRYSHR